MIRITVQGRILFVAFLLCAWLMAVGGKLAWLQLADHSRTDAKSKARDLHQVLLASRGSIYDRNGKNNPLAMSVPARFFFLDPKQVSDRHKPELPALAGRIAEVLELPADEILAKLKHPTSKYLPLGVFMEDEKFAAFDDKKLFSGIFHNPDSVRLYPQGSRMAHVVGFINRPHGVGKALAGAMGIEQRYEEQLSGVAGSIESMVDGRRREIYLSRTEHMQPIPGATVYLTLDNNIQELLERELRTARENTRALRAWGVIQMVKTGEILAMASVPGFDPNQPAASSFGDKATWDNLPLCINYEPGSTMKAVTVAAAIEEKIITPDTRFDVGHGNWLYEKHILNDKVYGIVDVITIIQKSSNIGTAKIALMLADNTKSIKNGRYKLQDSYLRLFGFGKATGVELPAEEAGILRSCERWDALSPTRIGIGQGVAVTAMQMVAAYSAIANGGLLMKPYLVQRVVADNGEVLLQNEPQTVARPISAATSAKMRKMLVGVTQQGGTAKRAAISGYSVAGKTGTAQIPKKGGYNNSDYWASFAGFCPAENAVFAMIIVIEEPRTAHTGGAVAAPVFAAVAEGTARYLGIPSDTVEREIDYLPEPTWFDTDIPWQSVDE